MRSQSQLQNYAAMMGLNLVDRKQFAKKKIYGSQYLLEPQDQNEQMGPTYHLNRFEEQLLQNAAKTKNLSSANLNTIGCQSMETADTYEKPILLDEQEDVDEEDAVLESEEQIDSIAELEDFSMPKTFDENNPYEEVKQPEQDDVGNYDPDLIEVPKMARQRSANTYTTRIVRMFNKKLQDFVRFSGLTGVRTVSDELCSESSFFSADSDQTLHSHRSQNQAAAMEEDGAVRLGAEDAKDPELQNELRRLRSSVDKFLKSQQGIDKVLQTETDVYDQVAADKRLKNAKWLSDLVLRKIEKTLQDVEIAQMQMELKARGAYQHIEEYIQKKVDAATEDIKREISQLQKSKKASK